MTWLRTGTVAVTSGSTTVTGTSTGFAANTRVGDAFIGPDGRQYELQNVASDTVISILPAYLGPTASGQPYAVMPVQGYQKLLADLVRDWTNQYGAKMAALGTTGNYDLLPVNKGGTGGTDQAAGRTGLGLGTAAVANVTIGPSDMTAGRLLKVGDFGIGGDAPAPPGNSMDSRVGTGVYGWSGAWSGAPRSGAAGEYLMLQGAAVAKRASQLALSHDSDQIWFRRDTGGFAPWRELYHTGNTTRGSGGALSAASPIVRVANVSDSQRHDLLEQTFEGAGDWGVANDEARGVSVERLGVGEYRVTGGLGLALEGWRTQDPCSPDGGRTLGISESEQDEDGNVTIRLFKQRWTLSEDGEMTPGRGAPLDVPLNSWIDVRLEMPQPEAPLEPSTTEAE